MRRNSLPFRRRAAAAIAVLALLGWLMSSCAVLTAGVNSNADGHEAERDVAGARTDQQPADREDPADPADPPQDYDDTPADEEELEFEEYSPVAVFNLAYNQTFFAGGYWVDDHGFEEGDAVRWHITAERPDAGSNEFEAERALVEINADGSQWWYIRYSQDAYRFECKVLLDEFATPVEMWHRQDSDQDPLFHEFDYEQAGHFGDAGSADLEALEEAGISTLVYLSSAEYERALSGRGAVRVPAGEFEADHLVYEFEDSQTGEQFLYEWWVTQAVPGRLVRYHWRDRQSGRELAGDLLEIVSDYSSPFEVR